MMTGKNNQTETLLMEHYRAYPNLQIKDVFKFLHQSSFGCEHLVTDPIAAIRYICDESKECPVRRENLIEELDGDFCRVHLGILKDGLSANTLGRLFFLSAKPVEEGNSILEEKLAVFCEMVEKGMLPFTPNKVKSEIAQWKALGYPACRHSQEFRNNYFPAYRVIDKRFITFLPLLVQMDALIQKGSLTMAIEGGSASGKTTLSHLLEMVYDACVFHMDDFFLRLEQRTPERFAQPGGNVDRERFLEEVLMPLKNKKTISYRAFDCSTLSIKSPVNIKPSRVNIIEGAYSMHPELSEYYNFSVFLDVCPTLQKERIGKRNTPAMAERFFTEWIPLEQYYFKEMQVKERCDMVLAIG